MLDGSSRYLVQGEFRETRTKVDLERFVQRAREKFPGATSRTVSDKGLQFISKDFKEFIHVCDLTHVRTSPSYPQSNGKIERFHRTIEGDCIRIETPLTREDAQRIVGRYVKHYNTMRLHSVSGYITLLAKLKECEKTIFAERDGKLEAAPERRK